MSQKMVLSWIVASALAMGVAGLGPAAYAQEVPFDIQCQYFTGEGDPLDLTGEISGPFNINVLAVEQNRNQTKPIKGTGFAEVDSLAGSNSEELEERVLGGSFKAEVEAKLKATQDNPNLICANSATARGVGFVRVDDGDGEAIWLMRDGSRFDGKQRVDDADCPEGFGTKFCSYHPVKVSIRFTAQGRRDNESLKYGRFNSNQKDVYEAYTGEAPTKSQSVVLACGCLEQQPIAPVEE